MHRWRSWFLAFHSDFNCPFEGHILVFSQLPIASAFFQISLSLNGRRLCHSLRVTASDSMIKENKDISLYSKDEHLTSFRAENRCEKHLMIPSCECRNHVLIASVYMWICPKNRCLSIGERDEQIIVTSLEGVVCEYITNGKLFEMKSNFKNFSN